MHDRCQQNKGAEVNTIDLNTLYDSTTQRTLRLWQHQRGNELVAQKSAYDPQKFAIGAGIQPVMSAEMRTLLQTLTQITRYDPLADVMPEAAFHFTFLPVTLPLWEADEPLPAKTQELLRIWANFQGAMVAISDLRLVVLPGQLLLAGIPDEQSVALRQQFCTQILASSWEAELRLRHVNTPLPAPFWHSTLLRYRAQCLPEHLQTFFLERQTCRYGDVCGALTLTKAIYNWAIAYPLGQRE
ncbi:hypothetical protein GTGU_00844 [Trabulsiella guamensis ATCC 49490]|uniref:DUF1868 domain-containing protein n=1 Tax=Trabulsiella guamensis ATCC 49490 TaxID=1005994 RepID=A0A085AGX1_9ENTR|nr:hypothetical protein [Trabulsiella guamensis]KFC09466.1 hypothetical protein GTGU_00844 [Trabulsiella guamensis ATCC 49490]